MPSPVGVRRPARPWNPLRLDWEVELLASPTGPSHWRLGELDFDPVDPYPSGGVPVVLSGIGWLSPAPADLAATAGRRARAGAPGATAPVDAGAAALEGFFDRVRGVPQGTWVGPRGVEDRPPRSVLDAESYPARSFVAGTWRLTRLRAVDTFGQVVVLYDPDAAAPQAAGPPTVPAELRVPGADGIALRPRFTAPATLAARFLDLEPGSDQEATAGRNPVGGFLVPSPFDGSVELVDPTGTSVGKAAPRSPVPADRPRGSRRGRPRCVPARCGRTPSCLDAIASSTRSVSSEPSPRM